MRRDDRAPLRGDDSPSRSGEGNVRITGSPVANFSPCQGCTARVGSALPPPPGYTVRYPIAATPGDTAPETKGRGSCWNLHREANRERKSHTQTLVVEDGSRVKAGRLRAQQSRCRSGSSTRLRRSGAVPSSKPRARRRRRRNAESAELRQWVGGAPGARPRRGRWGRTRTRRRGRTASCVVSGAVARHLRCHPGRNALPPAQPSPRYAIWRIETLRAQAGRC